MRIIKELLKDEEYKIFTDDEEIALYGLDGGMPNQELFFLMKQEHGKWNTYIVQRGKRFWRYWAETAEMSELCACLLFLKEYQFRPARIQWAEMNKLVQAGQLAEALHQVEQEIGTVQPLPITFVVEPTVYRVVFQENGSVEELYRCTNVLEALGLYRYHCLLYQYLNRYCDALLTQYPQLAKERHRLLLAVIK